MITLRSLPVVTYFARTYELFNMHPLFPRSFYIRFPKITLPCTPRLALNFSHHYNIHRYQSLSSVTLKRHLASEL
jgi:hypothetical protein